MVNPLLYVVLIVLILFSAFFSGTETAFASVNRIRLKYRAQHGEKRAEIALDILEHFDDALSAILIGNNIVNIGSASLATMICTEYFGDSLGPTISTVAMTLLVLTFGEILPKTIAKENAEQIALGVASILKAIMTIFKPLVLVFVHFKSTVMKLFKNKETGPSMTEQELKYMIEEIEDEGVLEQNESELIQSAMDFDETTVSDVLTHRVDVTAVDIDENIETVKELFLTDRYTRLPVYRKSIDNILGMIMDKDFFREYLKNPKFELSSILQEVPFIPPKKNISELLKDFQKNKTQMAVVADQYGGTLGIITVEDILEALVGDIWDEDEEITQDYIKLADNRYQVSGDMKISEFFHEIAPEYSGFEEESLSVTGWLMDKLERVPKAGDHYSDPRLSVTVTEMEDLRVKQVEIILTDPEKQA